MKKQSNLKHKLFFKSLLYKANISALITLFTFWPVTSFSQPTNILNLKLKQSVDTRNWSQAIQIVNEMIVANPSQADRLETYRASLEKLSGKNANSSVPKRSIEPSLSPAQMSKKSMFRFSNIEVRYDSTSPAEPNVYTCIRCYLTGKIYNRSNKVVEYIKVYYDVLPFLREYKTSVTYTAFDILPNSSIDFDILLPSGKNYRTYEPDSIRIRKIEWLDNDGSKSDEIAKYFEQKRSPTLIPDPKNHTIVRRPPGFSGFSMSP